MDKLHTFCPRSGPQGIVWVLLSVWTVGFFGTGGIGHILNRVSHIKSHIVGLMNNPEFIR